MESFARRGSSPNLDSDDDWRENRKYVVQKIDEHDREVSLLSEKLLLVSTELAILKTKFALYAALLGVAGAAAVEIVLGLLGKK